VRTQLVATGAVSVLAQVALLREVGVVFFGGELALVLGLGAWMLGTGLGAIPGRGGTAPQERRVRWALIAAGVLLPASVALARGIRPLLHGVPGGELPLARQPVALLACLLPTAVVCGLLFQWTARRYMATGRSLATAYAIESAGGLLGGLAATLLAASGRANVETVLAGSTVALLVAVRPVRRLPDAPGWIALLLLALVVASASVLPFLDTGMTRWTHPDLIATRDTPYARVTLTGAGGQIAVLEDDALAYESQGTAAEEFVHPAAVQRDTPARVIVLGGAAQGLLPEVLHHRPREVLDIELDRALVALVAPRLSDAARRALADPRVRIAYGDPRRLLERAGTCDLLLAGMPEPASGRTSRFYTREFLAECARHLAPDGVLAFRLRSAENLWSPLLTLRAAGISRALAEVFPHRVILPGAIDLYLASRSPLPQDPGGPCARLAARVPDARLVTPAYLHYLYTSDRFAAVAERMARSRATPNTDLRPACYQASMLLGVARFAPRIAQWEPSPVRASSLAASPWVWAGMLAAVVILALVRRRPPASRLLIAALAGGAGMTIESALLIHYQIRSGVLAEDLGVLLMAFMAGLAAGAPALTALRRGSQVPARFFGHAIAAAFVAVGLGTGALLRAGLLGGRLTTALALAVTGLLVAAAFAYAARGGGGRGDASHGDAARSAGPRAGLRVGPLYAADLAGGCVGAVLAGLALIPAAGLDATAAAGGLCAIAIAALS
jgi:spermidine synthase